MNKAKIHCCFWLFVFALTWFSSILSAQQKSAVVLTVNGAIGPATTDYINRAIESVKESNNAEIIIIAMDTPGGLDAATRDIIKAIIASPVPVATYVTPSGARAASAGTYILYGSHIAAMSPSTNLGAATPVQIGGLSPTKPEETKEKESQDVEDAELSEKDSVMPDNADAMTKKVVNDSAAYIRGLAELHGRNAEWAEQAVREAVSLTASEALEMNVIDYIAENIEDLLQQVDGKTIKVNDQEITLNTSELTIEKQEPDWRNQLLALITNPTVAYLLMLIGIYGLIFEGYNPGTLVPGVIGGICLLVAMYAFQVLPINYAGLALIILGVALMTAEAFSPSFGILGIGGIIALTIGSVMLIDTDIPGFSIAKELIAGIAVTSGIAFVLLSIMVVRATRSKASKLFDSLVNCIGTATTDINQTGQVRIDGEIWQATSNESITMGTTIKVVKADGLSLTVVETTGE